MRKQAKDKIILYNPRAVFYTMPLGLLAIGSQLDPARYDIKIIDARLERDPHAAVLNELEDALCLGVSVLTGAPIRDALSLTRAVQATRPDLPIVWGGWHPSLFPRECVAEGRVVAAVAGQGEETFAEIAERLANGAPLEGLSGCTHRAEGEIKTEAPRPLRNPNDFPAHNYDLLDVEAFFALKQWRQFDYISSVGCRFRCSFCADPFVYKRGWFGLAPERMGEELEYLWKRYRFADVSFQDETFFTSRARVESIAAEFLHRGLPFTWFATMRADQGVRLDEKLLADCKRAGLRRAMVGVESGSQPMLDWMKKDIKLDQVFETAEKLIRHDIGGLFPFIVGFPDETPESVAATLKVIKHLRAMSPKFEIVIYFYQPYPGSPLADLAWARGYPKPSTLQEWAAFDYVGARGPWVTQQKWDLIQRFKFYQKFAFNTSRHPLHSPLQWVSKARLATDFYNVPVEKMLIEFFKPLPRLS